MALLESSNNDDMLSTVWQEFSCLYRSCQICIWLALWLMYQHRTCEQDTIERNSIMKEVIADALSHQYTALKTYPQS